MRSSYYRLTFLSAVIIIQQIDLSVSTPEAPILNIDNQSPGYVGRISEHNVLVDLAPHLQIKNIEAINGICSYHVFKPNNEEFPFTVEIKDKSTGEAVIELIRKDLKDHHEIQSNAKQSAKSILLDCNNRKEYDFLIQAHDCSMPSLYSNKVPVKIEVVDSDDYLLQFDQMEYHQSLVKSEHAYENFMTIKAHDYDCTNNGYACSYGLVDRNTLNEDLPFKIDADGQISSTGPLNKAKTYDLKARAYDCVNNSSYVEVDLRIKVVEPCVPQWTDYPQEIISSGKSTNAFNLISSIICESEDMVGTDDSVCQIDSASSKLELVLDSSIKNTCESTDCAKTVVESSESSRKVIFSSSPNSRIYDDDSIEDDYYDMNKINSNIDVNGINLQPPLNYRSFSKSIENAQRIDFDGKFGTHFSLNAWIRRPPNADRKIKEQVLCGSDSLAMNRHHFGLYFYRGSLKFLMRKENSDQHQRDIFYPSLWEWSLPDSIQSDNKWHFYEIKLNYPTAMLYIDGVHFIENKTNSDIIDAYELADSDRSGEVVSYIGACYHARTSSLVDHFEGDIGSVVLLNLKQDEKSIVDQCNTKCHEFIGMNMVGNENLINSIEHVNWHEINIHSTNLFEMAQILRQIKYHNSDLYPQDGSRFIRLTTTVHCGNSGKQVNLNELDISVSVKRQTHEYNVQLEGDRTQSVTKFELENGIEPFREISIFSYEINKVDDSLNSASNEDALKLSKCSIKITPERNTMQPDQNYEKVMFLQNLLDEFKFEFKETADSVLISGVQTIKNYETFIRRLTYVITNTKEISAEKFIREKEFFISCVREQPNIETNTVIIQLNIEDKTDKGNGHAERFGFVAHKQAQKLVVNDGDNTVFLDKMNIPHSYNLKASKTSPIMVLLIAMSICGMGFFLIFGVIKINSLFFDNRRRALPNEENPNMDGMEWDDSGLNITENPLDKLEAKKESIVNLGNHTQNDYEYDEEYTSNEEDDEEYDQFDDQYSSEEENGPSVDRNGLEWDDTSIGIKMNKNTQLQSELSHNTNDL